GPPYQVSEFHLEYTLLNSQILTMQALAARNTLPHGLLRLEPHRRQRTDLRNISTHPLQTRQVCSRSPRRTSGAGTTAAHNKKRHNDPSHPAGHGDFQHAPQAARPVYWQTRSDSDESPSVAGPAR